jgi:hypothetical protein
MKTTRIITSIIALLLFANFVSAQVTFSPQNIVSDTATSASSVFTADFDNDGDMDILSSSFGNDKVCWYENTNGQGLFSNEYIISTTDMNVRSVYAADMDNDGDMDVLTASFDDHKIRYYENTGTGNFAGATILSNSCLGAVSVKAAYIDGDNLIDVISASYSNNTISWFQNLGNGDFSTENLISTSAYHAECVEFADLNNDGFTDIISASAGDDKIAWYENVDGTGNFSNEIIISTNADYAISVDAADMDSDGYIDLVSTSKNDNKIAWYKNTNGAGNFSDEIIISNTANQPKWSHICDLDGDSEMDVLVGSKLNSSVVWFNNTGSGSFSEELVISSEANNISKVFSCDLDNDTDLDVLSSSVDDNKIAWYENIKGETALNSFKKNSISMYPNPTSGTFTINGEGIKAFELINSFGQGLYHTNIATDKYTYTPAKDLSSGVYIVKIKTESKIVARKLIVK